MPPPLGAPTRKMSTPLATPSPTGMMTPDFHTQQVLSRQQVRLMLLCMDGIPLDSSSAIITSRAYNPVVEHRSIQAIHVSTQCGNMFSLRSDKSTVTRRGHLGAVISRQSQVITFNSRWKQGLFMCKKFHHTIILNGRWDQIILFQCDFQHEHSTRATLI